MCGRFVTIIPYEELKAIDGKPETGGIDASIKASQTVVPTVAAPSAVESIINHDYQRRRAVWSLAGVEGRLPGYGRGPAW